MGVRHIIWTAENIVAASELYRKGLSFGKIASKFGTTRDSVIGIAFRNRDLFPKRLIITAVKKNQPPMPKRPRRPPAEPTPFVDRVVRTTFSGAKVTMPRVAFIDGPAPAQSVAA